MDSLIILYEEDEKVFTSLGIGALSDAISCVVSEELNGAFELEMEYPITGAHYADLAEKRIILAKANDILQPQPFRIYKITRPIDGTVTVYAEHISYDTIKVPVRKFSAESLTDISYVDAEHPGALNQAQIVSSPFKFLITQDKQEGTDITYQTKHPYNMKALLMGDDDSILKTYDGEFIFDRFDITLCTRRGANRDFTIRYSKNMIDLEQETSSELMYTGICPYYSNTTTEAKVGLAKKYKEIYISNETVTPLIDQEGRTIYPSTWLTYKSTGIEPIKNILSLTVTNIIATEGDFENHLVTAISTKPQGSDEEGSYFIDVTYNIAYSNKNNAGGQNRYWLYEDIDLTRCYENEDHHVVHGEIYRIYTPGENLYKVFVFDSSKGPDGEFRLIDSSDNIKEYPPTMPSVDNTQEEKDLILVYEGDLIYIDEVRALPKEGETEYSATWLQKVEEQIQVINSDPRWKVPEEGGDIVQTVGTPSKIIYKVPSDEVATMAYPIEGAKEYTREWLSLEQGSTVPIPDEQLIDGKPFNVPRSDDTIYKCRWSQDDNKYNHRTDTRCVYTNYEWNGYSYVEHQTTDDKILTLDLSDKFKETPKDSAKFQKDLYDETMQYIKDAKLGTLKNSIKVSFVKLSSSPEYSKWKQLETVALGDTVNVIYEDLGVNEKKKVVKTEYNVLEETYDSIEIGDKGSSFVTNAVVQGDDISALTNDRNFADITTVTKLVAERIEADYIHALQAEITEAQIQNLTTTELNATIVTAQKFEIDKLVASLLTADDAAIRNTLVVGENLIVNGEVNITNGSISISGQERIDSARPAYVNPNATSEYGFDWLLENEGDLEPLTPENGIVYSAEYQPVGEALLTRYYKWVYPSGGVDGHYQEQEYDANVVFEVDESGNVTANSLNITGGRISINGSTGTSFEVDNDGNVTANSLSITGGTISIEGQNTSFNIDEFGNLEANSVELSGGTIENLHITGNIYFGDSAQSPVIDAYVRKHSITYKHTNVTMVNIWDSDEVRGEAKLTINTSLEMVGVYGTLEGLAYDDVLDARIYPYNSYTDPYITSFKVESVEDGEDFTSRFENYVEDDVDHQRIYYANSEVYCEYTYGSIWFDGSPAEDEIIAYDKQSNWLSLTDYVPGQGDGPALTPATGVIYSVHSVDNDGFKIFVGFYEWNGSSYVETEGPKYINEEGLRLNGIQIDDEQTRIGCLLVTETYLTTNPEKTSVDSFGDGLYIGTDGISLYDEEYNMSTKLSARSGLITYSTRLDIFKDTEHSYTDGATPILYLIPDPQYLPFLGSGTGRITGVAYDTHTYFTSYIERVLINANKTVTLNVQPSSTLYSPNLEKLTLIAAYATQTLEGNSTTLITKPLRVASEIGRCSTSSPRNIKIANDNSFAIYVNVCVVFKK